MLFQLMMGAAFAADVARAGQAALIEWDHMIEVTLLGRPTARREPAGAVPGDDQFGDPERRPVRRGDQAVVAPAGPFILRPPLPGGRGRPPGRCPCAPQDSRELGCCRPRWRRLAVWLLAGPAVPGRGR